jgi:HSP20 family protein
MIPEIRFDSGSLVREMEQLQRELNRVFSDVLETDLGQTPTRGGFPVNLYAGEHELVLTTEIPGVDPERVEVTVHDKVLTIAFSRPEETLQEGASYHRRERTYGRFSRSLELPIRVDETKVEALMEKGLLQIRLPRLEADKPRKIAIKAS